MNNWLQTYRKNIKDILYSLLILCIAGVLSWANYTPGAFLTGWDTLHPEFNFSLAFQRMLNGVWRTDQGLGAVAIQSHMADLPRVILLWIASWVTPLNVQRYLTFFTALFVGPLGAYALTSNMLSKQYKNYHFPAFFAGMAYLFNLATVQHFAVPLEMFAIHYALVPWLVLLTTQLLEHPTRKRWVTFGIITLLAAPQAHTATLFYAYFGMLFLFTSTYTLLHRIPMQRILGIITITLSLNAFWMLPNIYAVVTQGEVVRNSKVNQLFSEEAFRKNQQYGTWKDVLILKNFLYNWRLINPETLTESEVLEPWIEQLKYPITQAYLWLLPLLTIIGLLIAIRLKNMTLIAYAPGLVLSYLVIANNQWPTKHLLESIRDLFPLIGEALRFPFTKFSILLLASSVPFIGIAIAWFIDHIRERVARLLLYGALLVLPLVAFQPAFTGNLINPAMRLAIPSYYFNVFDWFKSQNPTGRVAILPAHSFWNWTNYRWGYQGAGFLQFGIPQPILDRDYDRWNPENENYYWELSRAIYTKEATELESVLSKYNVSYVLLDTSIISRENSRALYIDELTSMLSELPEYRLKKTFGTVSIYVKQNFTPDLTLVENLPEVSPAYVWNDNDIAYKQFRNYVVSDQNTNNTITYPYRSLFTKRTNDHSFLIDEIETQIAIRPSDMTLAEYSVTLDKTDSLAFAFNLSTKSFQNCGDTRTCLTLTAPTTPLSQGYFLAITYRTRDNSRLGLAILNDTAKHVEMQKKIPESPEWKKMYFVLPPLAQDGIGYTLYFSNENGLNDVAANTIKEVFLYKLPYQEMVEQSVLSDQQNESPTQFLIQHQTYHSGWKAYVLPNNSNRIAYDLPFLFGKEVQNHVLINNWANGWQIPKNIALGSTIVPYFMPQSLEWAGFVLLFLTFIYLGASTYENS